MREVLIRNEKILNNISNLKSDLNTIIKVIEAVKPEEHIKINPVIEQWFVKILKEKSNIRQV